MLKISPKGEVKGTTLTGIHVRTPDILGFWVAASSQSLCCSPTLRSGEVGSAPCHQKGKMKKHVTIEVLFSLKKNLVYFLKRRYRYKNTKLFYGTCCCNRYYVFSMLYLWWHMPDVLFSKDFGCLKF